MTNRYTFDTAYLRALAQQRMNIDELAKELGVSGDRIERLLSGKTEFRYSEMLALARVLGFTANEFEMCFFMPESLENLN